MSGPTSALQRSKTTINLLFQQCRTYALDIATQHVDIEVIFLLMIMKKKWFFISINFEWHLHSFWSVLLCPLRNFTFHSITPWITKMNQRCSKTPLKFAMISCRKYFLKKYFFAIYSTQWVHTGHNNITCLFFNVY